MVNAACMHAIFGGKNPHVIDPENDWDYEIKVL